VTAAGTGDGPPAGGGRVAGSGAALLAEDLDAPAARRRADAAAWVAADVARRADGPAARLATLPVAAADEALGAGHVAGASILPAAPVAALTLTADRSGPALFGLVCIRPNSAGFDPSCRR